MTTEAPLNIPLEASTTDTPVARSGDDLRAHREAMKLSINDVAQRLKLQPRQVAAIESDDWAALPGTAFIRGSLRSYGKNLAIDVTPMLETIGGHARPAELQNAATLDTPMPRPGGGFDFHSESPHRSWAVWAVVGVVGVLALLLFFGRDGDLGKVKSWIGNDQAKTAPDESTTTTAAATSSLPPDPVSGSTAASGGSSAPIDATKGNAASSSASQAPVTSASGAMPASGGSSGTGAGSSSTTAQGGTNTGAPGSTTGGSTADKPAGPTTTAAAAPPKPPAEPPPEKLYFKFSQTAWLEVKQLDGKVLFAGYGKLNEPKTVTGKTPLKITVGNANQVQFEYRGAEYDMRPYAVDNVARFTLKE